MPAHSHDYNALTTRLNELQAHLLDFLPTPPASRLVYSNLELDKTRAYVVLAHAEIENYCEQIVDRTADTARRTYYSKNKISPTLRKMIMYFVVKKGRSLATVKNPPPEIIEAALQSIRSTLNDNNGVKARNIEKLVFPVGLLEHQLDPIWLADMDSFGANRGGWAHKTIRLQQPPDPPSQLRTVSQLLPGLLALDQFLKRLR